MLWKSYAPRTGRNILSTATWSIAELITLHLKTSTGKTVPRLNDQKENIAFLIILVFSALFYLFNINFSDLWIDEAFSKALIRHSFSEISGLLKNDFHPPLYFYGLKLFTGIVGISTFTTRVFSVLGVLSTLVLGYASGQRAFGRRGALYFCLLLLSLPMLSSYSHITRMYTWAAFSMTGVFLYSYLFITENKKSDLVLLVLFTLIAAYTHYYGLVAACSSNLFVLVYLLLKRNTAWRSHVFFAVIAFVLYLPWFFVLVTHIGKVQASFWVPEVGWHTILGCFINPFGQLFWLPRSSYIMIVIVYILTAIAMYRNYIACNDKYGIALSLSMFIFGFTVLGTAIISQFTQPILFPRYIVVIVTILMVPPTLFFISCNSIWLKGILLGILLSVGLYTSYGSSCFSYGPYKQSMEYLADAQPDVRNIIHGTELTTGPMLEYNENARLNHYWFQNEKTTAFTNLDVFDDLHKITSLDQFLYKDEVFCLVGFDNSPLNKDNISLILSETQTLQIDTIADNKSINGPRLLLYILKYQGRLEKVI
jgi:uncharacterized membrane protein